MSTAPGSASRQFRPKKKKGSSSSRPPSKQNLHQSSVRSVKLEDTKDDHCSEDDVRLHGSKVQKPKKSPAVLSPGPRPFRIICGDPFVPGTDNYKRMVADRRLQYERGQNGGVFSVCEGDPCSPDNFLKNVAGNCYGPYRRARLAYSLP